MLQEVCNRHGGPEAVAGVDKHGIWVAHIGEPCADGDRASIPQDYDVAVILVALPEEAAADLGDVLGGEAADRKAVANGPCGDSLHDLPRG